MISENIDKQLLAKAVDDVFSTMLNLSVTNSEMEDGDNFYKNEHITATIGFAGGWNGFVSISCSANSARLITSLLLGTGDGDIPFNEIRDAVGEVVNMIGGRFKALFSEYQNSGKEVFKMSIPSVVQGKEYKVFAPANSGVTKLVVKVRDEKLSALLALSKNKN